MVVRLVRLDLSSVADETVRCNHKLRFAPIRRNATAELHQYEGGTNL